MKVLIFINKLKKESETFLKSFCKILDEETVVYEIIDENNLNSAMAADAVFVFGGDGTILALTKFCNKNGIPIIGVNAGKVGFLTEFEQNEIRTAVRLLKDGKLKKDKRATIVVSYKGKKYYGLNDAVIQRVYSSCGDGLIISVSVSIGDVFVDKISGDGVIISTPTGSTAYSLSAGGSILSPEINACIMTPLAAHSLHNRPIVFSADSSCALTLNSEQAGLFVDGKMVATLKSGETVSIRKSPVKTVFLRKTDSDFYMRLDKKLNN